MEIIIVRDYEPTGTNGSLLINGIAFMSTIELPWKENKRRVSCIPAGRYPLQKRYSTKFRQHIQVMNVPGRDLILIHPANDALKELNGCIALVTILQGAGRGLHSRIATGILTDKVYEALDNKEPVFLTIK